MTDVYSALSFFELKKSNRFPSPTYQILQAIFNFFLWKILNGYIIHIFFISIFFCLYCKIHKTNV